MAHARYDKWCRNVSTPTNIQVQPQGRRIVPVVILPGAQDSSIGKKLGSCNLRIADSSLTADRVVFLV